jgi:hypothetical protein
MRNVARTQTIAVDVVVAAAAEVHHQFPPSPVANAPVLSVQSILRAQFPAAHRGTTYLPDGVLPTTSLLYGYFRAMRYTRSIPQCGRIGQTWLTWR